MISRYDPEGDQRLGRKIRRTARGQLLLPSDGCSAPPVLALFWHCFGTLPTAVLALFWHCFGTEPAREAGIWIAGRRWIPGGGRGCFRA